MQKACRFIVMLCVALGVFQTAEAAQLTQLIWSKNPDQSWATKRAITKADWAAISAYRNGLHGKPVYATHFTDPAQLASQWLLKTDDSWGLKSCRRPKNLLATKDGLWIQTRIASDCAHATWSTGSMWSKARYRYGFFEATFKTADSSGLNNAFWLTTDDGFEIDAPEVHYPNIAGLVLHNWAGGHDQSNGFRALFADDFSASFHDFGVLWTPTDIIYEIDGKPVAALAIHGSVHGTADIRFSTAIAAFAGAIPAHPEGHDMFVTSLRVFAL
jgi:hypothetical protein